jgi:hypothetical protein
MSYTMHVRLRLGSEFRLYPARTPCSLKAELQTFWCEILAGDRVCLFGIATFSTPSRPNVFMLRVAMAAD